MIAHWNWMDPSIANLVPVLDSYWLMIHVSVIVGSYGPFTLGMILGIVSLILMVFLTKNNKEIIKLKLKELTIINELAITVGLIMLIYIDNEYCYIKVKIRKLNIVKSFKK